MKHFRLFFILSIVAASAGISRAQHTLQVDDGAGHYTVLQGQTVDALDFFNFPVGGGTLLVTPIPGIHSLVWLTAGNTGTGGSPSTPTDIFGTTNPFDVIMAANNVEKMRLVSGGGVKIGTGSPNGLQYVDGNQALNKVLTSDIGGNASWQSLAGLPGVVNSAQGTAPITVNGDNNPHGGPITIAVTTGAVSTPNSTLTLGGTGGKTVAGTLTADLNLGHANTWLATQTFPNSSITNAELANSSINFTYGTGISGPASIALGGSGLLTNTGVTSLAFTGGTLYGNIAAATGGVNLTPVLNTQTAATVFAGPTSGVPATPTFRALANTDLPGNGAITVNGSTGLSVGGSPVSLGGTLTLTNTGVTSNIAGTGIGVSGATGAVTITNTGVTSLAFTGGTLYGNIAAATGAVNLTPALNTQTANTFFAGPTSGVPATPTFRALTAADLGTAAVTSATGTAPITINGVNTAQTGAITIAVTTGAVSTPNGSLTLGGTGGQTVSGTLTADINLTHANTWTGTQTFGGVTYSAITPLALTANTDNYALSASNTYFRISSSAPINLTGITGGVTGRILILQNVGANAITLKSQTTSAATNQFDLPGGNDIILGPKGVVSLTYDGTLGFWEVVSTN